MRRRNSTLCYAQLAWATFEMTDTITYTAEYWYIELALEAHEKSYRELESRMDNFQPLPLDAFRAEWNDMWAQMRPLNPGQSDEDLKGFIDGEIAAGRSPEMQFMREFLEPFAAEAVAITILSHALAEATINAILAIGLSHVGKPQLFQLLESSDVKQKWTIGPQSFISKYTFEKSGSLFETLSLLCKRRNAYVHSKITLRNQANQILVPGTRDSTLSMSEDGRKWLRRFVTLPYELHRELCTQLEQGSLRFRIEHVLKKRLPGRAARPSA
jgi:hypothetical protein